MACNQFVNEITRVKIVISYLFWYLANYDHLMAHCVQITTSADRNFLVSCILNVHSIKMIWSFDISMPTPNCNCQQSLVFFGPVPTFGPMYGPPEKVGSLKIIINVKEYAVNRYLSWFHRKQQSKVSIRHPEISFCIDFSKV